MLDAALAAGLVSVFALIGCEDPFDGRTTDLPLAHIPASIVNNPRNDNTASAGTGNNAPGTPTPSGAPFFQAGFGGIQLFLGCPGDLASNGSTIPNYNCANFLCRAQAQSFFDTLIAAGRGDCHGLDGDNNTLACEGNDTDCTQ